jgi:mono/diheme cytochrome c family protein
MHFPPWLLPLALLPFACGSREVKVPTPATFQSIEALSIGPKCVQCHQSLATYAGVIAEVTPGNAAKSTLYQQVSSGSMPQQSTPLSLAEISAINTWIQNGANND